MVKANVKQDYYADLELTNNATPDEIKKQFRKLAKIYHPDRNPGREVEFNSKFQSIQAAHEILTDPEQRRKYDLERQRGGYNNIYSNTTRQPGPTRAATTNGPPPPPPRRAGTTHAGKTAFPTSGVNKPPPSSGAQRYAGWAARASAQEWQQAKEEAQARADAFPGFSDLRSGPTRNFPGPPPQPAWRKPRPGPRPASSYVPPTPNDGINRSATWDQFPTGQTGFPGMSRTQTSRKKQGFDPSTPSGDEHMAGTSAYARTHRDASRSTTQAEPSYFDVRKPQTASDESFKKPTQNPLRHARSHDEAVPQRPGLERQSTKYAEKPKEKTNLFGPGLGRSSSVRTSPIDPRYNDRSSQRPHSHHGTARFRSASPGMRSPMAEASYSSESVSSSSSEEEELLSRPRPKATPRQRPNKFGRVPTFETPNGQAGNDSYQYNTSSPQQDKTATYQYPPPPPKNRPFFPGSSTTHGTDEQENLTRDDPSLYENPSLSYTRKWSQDWGFSPRKGESTPFRNLPLWAIPSSISPESLYSKRRFSTLSEVSEDIPMSQKNETRSVKDTIPLLSQTSTSPQANRTNIFSSASTTAANPNHDNLPKSFDSSEWDGKFDSLNFAPSSSAQDRRSPSKTTRKGSTQPRGRTNSPGKDDASSTEIPIPSSKADAFQAPKFDADKWREQLSKDQTWTMPNSEGQRSKTPRRVSKAAAKKPSHIKQPENVKASETVDQTPNPAANGPGLAKSVGVDEMDIDTPGVPTPPNDTVPNNTAANKTQLDQEPHGSVNLDDLGHVHPFKPSSTGLHDLDDLTTNLPFESRAAQSLNLNDPSNTLKTINDLKLPRPPKAPIAPMEDSLAPGRWVSYSTSMSAYMNEWTTFNKQILEHFQVRQARIDHNMAASWISAVGDGPSDLTSLKGSNAQAGYKTYMSWIEQDAAVREWWNVACERHAEAMKELGIVREKMKAGNARTSNSTR